MLSLVIYPDVLPLLPDCLLMKNRYSPSNVGKEIYTLRVKGGDRGEKYQTNACNKLQGEN